MGWYFAILRAELSPVNIKKTQATNPNTAATIILCFANDRSCLFNKNHALTPITNIDATTYPDEMVCRNLLIATGENSTSQKLTISFRAVLGLNFMPAGYCIHALATNIHKAERFEPIATKPG